MFHRKRKKILQRVMCREPFVAAYSSEPFFEMKDGASYPDYVFDEHGGLYWCVRVGEIEIPWGFGDEALGFGANGSLIVKRRNVDAASFDMKGTPQARVGDISYVFVNRATERGREGLARYLEPRLIPIIKELASRCGHEGFADAARRGLPENGELVRLLDEHEMTPVSVYVRSVLVYDKK